MDPQALARSLCEELRENLAESGVSPALLEFLAVQPPADLRPGSSFLVSGRASGGKSFTLELAAGLAVGYLADEEAAVDEWKSWVGSLAQRLIP